MSCLRTSLCLVVLALVATACASPGDDAPAADGALPTVLVSTSVWGDVVTSLLAPPDGEAIAAVEVLMPAGVDPHSYEPSAADARALREADLVIVNGLGLEEAVLDALEAAAEDGVRVLSLGERLDPLPAYEAHTDEDEHADEDDAGEHAEEDEHADEEGHADEGEHAAEEGHADHGGLDPHVWLDPLRIADAVTLIAEEFADIAPDASVLVRDRAAARSAAWIDLDAELQDALLAVPPARRALVTGHDSLGYLADRYDLEVAAVVAAGGDTARSAGFADTIELLRERGIPAVFSDAGESDRAVQALAAEVEGLQVVELFTGSLGPEGSGAETLEGLLRTDVARIAEALA